jgi:hypothetical protein
MDGMARMNADIESTFFSPFLEEMSLRIPVNHQTARSVFKIVCAQPNRRSAITWLRSKARHLLEEKGFSEETIAKSVDTNSIGELTSLVMDVNRASSDSVNNVMTEIYKAFELGTEKNRKYDVLLELLWTQHYPKWRKKQSLTPAALETASFLDVWINRIPGWGRLLGLATYDPDIAPQVAGLRGLVERAPEVVRAGTRIKLKVPLTQRGAYLVVLEWSTSGRLYCLVPSSVGPAVPVQGQEIVLPADGSFCVSAPSGEERLMVIETPDRLEASLAQRDQKTPADRHCTDDEIRELAEAVQRTIETATVRWSMFAVESPT